MAEKKKAKQSPKKNAKKDSKWTAGVGVPVDSKKVKWAAKY